MSSTDDRQITQQQDLPDAHRPADDDPTENMSFLEHLEELRWRIIKGFGGILFGMLIAFIFQKTLVNKVLLGPAHANFFVYRLLPIHAINLTLQSRKLPGQFFAYWGTIAVVGAIIGSPIMIYQLWGFIEPALERVQKWKTRANALFITSFFLAGVSFGYLVLVPFALQFFSQFRISDVIINQFDINAYFSSLTMWILACGIIFELPVVSYYLAKMGLITPHLLKKYRRHAIVIAFILGAILTPPDPISQTLVAVPIFLLYQLSIYISKIGLRQYQKKHGLI